MKMPEPRIVEWYRADPWPSMRRVLVPGAATVSTGGLVIGLSFVARQSLDVRLEATVAGFLLVALGAAFTILGMHRILRAEVSLVLRTDGVCVQSARQESLVPWDDLQEVHWDPGSSTLVLHRRGGSPLVVSRPRSRSRSQPQGPALAARVLQLKRRSAMQLRS
jgi:hypothetical protein